MNERNVFLQNLPDIPVNQIEQQLIEVSTKMGQFTTLETRLFEASNVSMRVLFAPLLLSRPLYYVPLFQAKMLDMAHSLSGLPTPLYRMRQVISDFPFIVETNLDISFGMVWSTLALSVITYGQASNTAMQADGLKTFELDL